MDNLTHSLAGAALGQAGLKKKTGLGMAALIIAANLPDVDVLGLLFGHNLAWRRGWTHGPIAMLVLPPLLVAALVWFDKWQTRRGTRPLDRLPLHYGWLFALAYIGWASHPALDYLNTYGIRLLMPFSDRWFYGDTLFIIDLWVWLALGLGVFLSRRSERRSAKHSARPAWIGLGLSAVYIGTMGASSIAAERMARAAAEAKGVGPITEVVASPVPLNPFRRDILFATPTGFGLGSLNWLAIPQLTLTPGLTPNQMDNPLITEARKSKEVADFLYWARLPYARFEKSPSGQRVTLSDARYMIGNMRGPFTITVDLPSGVGKSESKNPQQRP